MHNTTKNILWAALGLSLFTFTSCDKHDHDDHNHEGELITTVKLTLKNTQNASDSTVATWRDLDGDGGQNPTIDTLKMYKGVIYTGKIQLQDQSKNPAEDITTEIKNEANDHLFVYKPSTGAGFTVEITDKDGKNLPLGIESKFTVSSTAANGMLNVVLRHQPGTKDGSATPGSSDVDITFPVKIR